MIRTEFRPWGDINWILDNLQPERWSFAGAVSMEDRCISSIEILVKKKAIQSAIIFRIQDAESRYFAEVERKTDVNEIKFKKIRGAHHEYITRSLLGRHGNIALDIDNFFNNGDVTDLVIDISSLPKKIFFLLIRKSLEQSDKLRNIVVTYTDPETYSSEPLAENPQGWSPLPGFLPPRMEPANKNLIIGLGYEPLGLPELYSSGLFSNANIRLLFPFPAQPNSVARNWDFARLLEPVPGNTSQNIIRIDSYNVPDMFDKLVSITENGDVYSILAPFGPKPMSLAMCLFASAYANKRSNPSVFYTQPTVYHPNYSTGVKMKNGSPSVNAYCIRLNGKNIYNES